MEDFLDINQDWFLKKYIQFTPKRYWTTKTALSWFLQNNGTNIVETGTTRMKEDWGAGQSTLLFGDFCNKYKRYLWTVDIDANALVTAKEITGAYEKNITYVQDDSLHFLLNFKQPVDLLYLDSRDCDPRDDFDNRDSQQFQKQELEAIYDQLTLRACVLLDDNYFKNGGKTRLAKEYIKSKGWLCLMDYYQSLWIRG